MKIAIVGADKTKWTEEQKEKAQIEIYKIFINKFKWLCPICGEIVFLMSPSFPRKKYKTSAHCPKHGTVNACLSKEHLVLVSGHHPKGGVEIWAEEVADKLGIKKEIYPAEVNQWEDEETYESVESMGCIDGYQKICKKGYHSRNIQIAEACDVLYDIEPKKPCPNCKGKMKIKATRYHFAEEIPCPKC